MRKMILSFALAAMIIPVTMTSCKENNRNNRPDTERTNNDPAEDSDTWNKVKEKADRAVGDHEAALERAKQRVRNAEDNEREAIQEGNEDKAERARKEKRNAEKEIRELEQKIRDENLDR